MFQRLNNLIANRVSKSSVQEEVNGKVYRVYQKEVKDKNKNYGI